MNYLQATYFLNFESEPVQKIISEFNYDDLTTQEKAIAIYNKVRDNWRYDPYSISLAKDDYKAST